MKFFCIVNDTKQLSNPDTFALLQSACQRRGIEFSPVEAYHFDFADSPGRIVQPGDIVYRLSTTGRAKLVEALLVQKGVATLYTKDLALFARELEWSSDIRLAQQNRPVIPTIYGVGGADVDTLRRYTEALGGFPVVLKAAGGSHGGSVMRLDSLASLRSVLGFVADNASASFVLKKYIDNAIHLRCIVLGGKVVDAVTYLPQKDDFRTNAVLEPVVETYRLPPEIARLAVQAVQDLSLAFGGVDVLVDTNGTAWIAEVNFPCNFARCQLKTGVDIAGMLVDYLVAKAKNQG